MAPKQGGRRRKAVSVQSTRTGFSHKHSINGSLCLPEWAIQTRPQVVHFARPLTPNGDEIYNCVLASLMNHTPYSPEEVMATEALICFTIDECGIFNETK